MASDKHLSILGQGVEVWNQWRRENPKIKPNLQGADLNEASLDWFDFSQSDLSEIKLCGAS